MTVNGRIRLLAALVLVLALAIVAGCTTATQTDDSAVPSGSNTKTIKLSSNAMGIYNPQEIRVRAGTTVRIEGDPDTLTGGMDTVVIEGFGINKKIAPSDNIIEFVADKPGEYEVRCANYMGKGKLIVE